MSPERTGGATWTVDVPSLLEQLLDEDNGGPSLEVVGLKLL